MSDLNEYNNQETPVNTQAEEQPAVNMTETGIAAEPQAPADMGPEIVSGTEPVKKKHKALFAAAAAVGPCRRQRSGLRIHSVCKEHCQYGGYER